MIPLAALFALSIQTPLQGQALLDDMSRRAVQFFYDQSYPTTGFTKDRNKNSYATDSTVVASTASTGFALTGLCIGAKRGYLTTNQARTRARTTLQSLLNKTERTHGWYYHWIHWQTGDRYWNSEVSSIDSGILFMGVIAARQYFNDNTITNYADQILNSVDWNWMLTDGGTKPNSRTFSMGYTAEDGWISNRWDGYSEQKLLMLLALGKDPSLSSEVWTAPSRPVSTYSGIELISGGPLFMHQMSESWLDFEDKRDSLGFDYWVATKRAALANRQYCINNPKSFAGYGTNFWGLTACDGPDGYSAFGAPVWGDDNGTVAPTCLAAAVPYAPSEAQQALDWIARTYPSSYGRYGFANGINVQRNWIGPDVVGIDLGMAMCAIENLRDGFVHKTVGTYKPIVAGFDRAGFKKVRIKSKLSTRLQS